MRTVQGTIHSAKMTGTVTVIVHTSAMHPVYKKRYRKSKKFMADSNGHDLYVGDLVEITECRPMSKNKHFKVTEIIQAAPRVADMANEQDVEKQLHREKKEKTEDSSSAA